MTNVSLPQPVLKSFLREQFRREDCWCWETLIEKAASEAGIPLDGDRLTYAGGALRTGGYRFRNNNAEWRALCERMQTDEAEAERLLAELDAALRSPHAAGVAYSWRRVIDARVDSDETGHADFARRLLQWKGDVYRDSRNASPCVDAHDSVIYALWRVDELEKPVQPFPLYVGEARGTARTRLESSHRHWWGDGKAIGVTVVTSPPELRVEIEKALITMLLPFCNIKGRRFDDLESAWSFPRP